MSDITLDNLNSLENKILDFGLKFEQLLERTSSYLNGGIVSSVNEREFENMAEEIISNMILLKEEMHKRVEEIYKENRYSHLTKLQNDLIEQFNALTELKNKIKSVNI